MKPTLAVPLDGSATAYHRIMQPLHALLLKGKPVQFLGETHIQPSQYEWADILYVQCLYAPGAYQFYFEQRELGKRIICDFDDDYFNIPEDSPEQTEIIDHVTGETLQFSAEMRTVWVKLFLSLLDVLVVTTEELRNLYQPFTKKVVVIPNCVSEDMARDVPKKPHDKVRILWTGSSSHLPDLALIKKPLQRVRDQIGDKVEIHFQGPLNFESVFPDIPHIAHPVTDYGDYLNVIQGIDADIALMPLVSNKFNAAKSNLKYCQMSLLDMATVASNHGPYKSISHGENGMLVSTEDEWVESVIQLVEDSEKRQNLAKAAADFVRAEHLLKKYLPRWEFLLI
jgi:glycosyltransferase involved in cell wall biosynthesis